MLGKIEGNPWKDDEMVGWHPCLNRHESEQIPGDRKDREAWRTAVDLATEKQQQIK